MVGIAESAQCPLVRCPAQLPWRAQHRARGQTRRPLSGELDIALLVGINKWAIVAVDNSNMTADAARPGLLARYPLFFFFLLCFVLTWGYFWLIWAPLGLPHSLIALG